MTGEHEHNDTISLLVRIDGILESGGESRVHKFDVTTGNGMEAALIVWRGSPAADVDWQRGEWYRVDDGLVKKWSSGVELNAVGGTTATPASVSNPDADSGGTSPRKSGSDSSNEPRENSGEDDAKFIPLEEIPGMGDVRSNAVRRAGYASAQDVAAADVDDLGDVEKIGSSARSIQEAARELCGYQDTFAAELADEIGADRSEVAEAYASLASYTVPPAEAESSIRHFFDDDGASVFDLSDYHLSYRHFLYRSGFRSIGEVAQASIDDLTDVRYVGESTAEGIRKSAREIASEQTRDESQTVSGRDNGKDYRGDRSLPEGTTNDSGTIETPCKHNRNENEKNDTPQTNGEKLQAVDDLSMGPGAAIAVQVVSEVKCDHPRQETKVVVRDSDGELAELRVFRNSPVTETMWIDDRWYRLENVTRRRDGDRNVLKATADTTVDPLGSKLEEVYDRRQATSASREASEGENTDPDATGETTVLHVGPVNYGSSNVTTARRGEFRDSLAEVSRVAIDRGVDAIVQTGTLFATRSPVHKSVENLVDILTELVESGVRFVHVGSERDHDMELVDDLVARGLIERPDESPIRIGDTAVYGIDPSRDRSIYEQLGSFDPLHERADTTVVAAPTSVEPPASSGEYGLRSLTRKIDFDVDLFLFGTRNVTERSATRLASGAVVHQLGPTELLLRKNNVFDDIRYPRTTALIGTDDSYETVELSHRPVVVYEVECSWNLSLSAVVEHLRTDGCTVFVRLTGDYDPDYSFSENELSDWLDRRTRVNKVWDDRSIVSGAETDGIDTRVDVSIANAFGLEDPPEIDPIYARGIDPGESLAQELAPELDAETDEVIEAYSEIADKDGSASTKKEALRRAFSANDEPSVFDLDGFSLETLYPLYRDGFETPNSVADASREALTDVGIEISTASRIQDSAHDHLSAKRIATESGGTAIDSGTTDTESPDPVQQAGSDDSARIGKVRAQQLLQKMVGPDATFRPDQWEAIDRLVNDKKKLLIVQRTGWGKSTVYFIATRLLRDKGSGPTLVVSPLLALMRNQIQDAEDQLGLEAHTINSNNTNDWDEVVRAVTNGTCDILLISPERLANDEFRRDVLEELDQGFGMFVVDEAHCISSWGHDFRPDYRRIKRIVERLPENTPVAATTATANDRVVEDITDQLPAIEPLRGKLLRESIRIQTIEIDERERRLAWLAENLSSTPGAGIVYCLTTDEVEAVSEWLQIQGIDAKPYHGRLDGERRQELESELMDNEVDALVATNALGMGFNKPDLGFVIHFQRPPNLIRYYQEIGRAGRDLKEAFAVLLAGEDDDDIAEYFIENAFPEQEELEAVLSVVEDSEDPLYKYQISKRVNLPSKTVSKSLDMLRVDGAVVRVDNGFLRTRSEWQYDGERIERVTEQRWRELERIQEFVRTDGCLARFIDDELDGELDEDCGQCANCTDEFLPTEVKNEDLVGQAIAHYRAERQHEIEPRKWIPLDPGESKTREQIPPERRLEPGRSLSIWDDPGWGRLVRVGKYERDRFDESLVTGAADLIRDDWDPEPFPAWVTAVPSTSNEGIVTDFAERLADRLDLPFERTVTKDRETKQQKNMANSYQQCWNVKGAFSTDGEVRESPVLLVDDVVCSRWTLTEVGRTLREDGSGPVYPFALAERRGGSG